MVGEEEEVGEVVLWCKGSVKCPGVMVVRCCGTTVGGFCAVVLGCCGAPRGTEQQGQHWKKRGWSGGSRLRMEKEAVATGFIAQRTRVWRGAGHHRRPCP